MFSRQFVQQLDDALQLTASNTGMVLNVALNYSARTELTDAFNSILTQMLSRTNTSRCTRSSFKN